MSIMKTTAKLATALLITIPKMQPLQVAHERLGGHRHSNAGVK